MRLIKSQKRSVISYRSLPKRGLVQMLLLLYAVLSISACGTARVNQFKAFSQAGTAYSEAAKVVLKEASDTGVDESSINLSSAREKLPENERGEEILKTNERDRKLLEILDDIQRHNALLSDYFAALGALAESDAPKEIGKSADGLFGALSKLHPEIGNASVFGKEVKGFIEPAVTLVVAQFHQAALEKELNDRAPAIERELALQQAAMQAVSEGLQARLEEALTDQESTVVVLPYVDQGKPPKNPLPGNWATRRRQILSATVAAQSVTTAAEAAKKLKKSFEALVRNELSPADLHLLLQDINRVLATFQAINASAQTS